MACTVLAVLLERIAEQACADSWEVTEPSLDALKRLKFFENPQASPVLKLGPRYTAGWSWMRRLDFKSHSVY